MDKLKHLSKQLLAENKRAQETYLKSILSTEVSFYTYVKMRKGSRENIPAIKDCSGRIITDPTEKAKLLNSYYSTIFSCEDNIPHTQGGNNTNPFAIDIITIRRRLRAIGKNKSVGPDRISGEIIKMGGGHDSVYSAATRNNNEQRDIAWRLEESNGGTYSQRGR